MIAPDSTLVGAARELEDALRLKLRRKEIDADIQARTQRKNFIRKRLRRAAGAAVLAGLLVYLSPTKLFLLPTTSSNIETPPPAEAAKVTAQEAANEEAMPPVGTGQDFSRQNLRYCHFQKERLLIIKQAVQRVEDKGCRHQGRGYEKMVYRPTPHIGHAEQYGSHPAGCIS